VPEPFVVRRLEDVDGYADEGHPQWHMIRSTLGIGAFGVNAWRSTAAGQAVIGEHTETGDGAGGHEELYLVLEGRATFTVDGVAVPAPRGTLVHVPDPSSRRSAVADEAGTVVLVVGGRPGAAFTVSSWERSAEALRLWRTEEWQEAIALLSRQLVDDPANANVLYNLACAEARDGRSQDALDHLTAAVQIDPRFAELASKDDDLNTLRTDSRFPQT
jgi:tetratricopeptide (TPR) repeat protein